MRAYSEAKSWRRSYVVKVARDIGEPSLTLLGSPGAVDLLLITTLISWRGRICGREFTLTHVLLSMALLVLEVQGLCLVTPLLSYSQHVRFPRCWQIPQQILQFKRFKFPLTLRPRLFR